MRGAPRLLLFDVDGTLLDCGGQPRPLLGAALAAVYGTAGAVDECDFAGKTDDQIVGDLLTAAGVPPERVESGWEEAKHGYLSRLEVGLDRRRMRLLPGVAAVLEALAARPDLELGLLTGNWERGARIKLGRYDLNRFFGFGAFGDGHRRREDLPPVALARARAKAGKSFDAERTVIVGDTAHDVRCARAHGIRCLAVATGSHSARRLQAAGAEHVVADLTAAADFLVSRPER